MPQSNSHWDGISADLLRAAREIFLDTLCSVLLKLAIKEKINGLKMVLIWPSRTVFMLWLWPVWKGFSTIGATIEPPTEMRCKAFWVRKGHFRTSVLRFIMCEMWNSRLDVFISLAMVRFATMASNRWPKNHGQRDWIVLLFDLRKCELGGFTEKKPNFTVYVQII